MQAAVLALVNAMMTVNVGEFSNPFLFLISKELTERISYRNDLRAVSFNEVFLLFLRLTFLARQSCFLTS